MSDVEIDDTVYFHGKHRGKKQYETYRQKRTMDRGPIVGPRD